MLTAKDLRHLQQVDIEKVDKTSLVDSSEVRINADARIHERFTQVMEQVKNPFAFMVRGYAVKVEYADHGIPLCEALEKYIASMRAGC